MKRPIVWPAQPMGTPPPLRVVCLVCGKPGIHVHTLKESER